ncbi:cell division protein FtsB-like protein [Anopheles sinensis]|uniref:Cell division protein FtsB-like protein n=1 Tax=Anopheles sinensis TaxID=74873 RepID=A0A084VZH3_ANOSI|nr:cell division protein FtsB-like protein [Anopheles sinensis]
MRYTFITFAGSDLGNGGKEGIRNRSRNHLRVTRFGENLIEHQHYKKLPSTGSIRQMAPGGHVNTRRASPANGPPGRFCSA